MDNPSKDWWLSKTATHKCTTKRFPSVRYKKWYFLSTSNFFAIFWAIKLQIQFCCTIRVFTRPPCGKEQTRQQGLENRTCSESDSYQMNKNQIQNSRQRNLALSKFHPPERVHYMTRKHKLMVKISKFKWTNWWPKMKIP